MKYKTTGGPVPNEEIDTSDVTCVAIPMNEQLRRIVTPDSTPPFAIANYEATGAIVKFVGLTRVDKQPFSVKLVSGPLAGVKNFEVHPLGLQTGMLIGIGEDGAEYKKGYISSAVEYELREENGEYAFHFVSMTKEGEGENYKKVKEFIHEKIAIEVANNFYKSPNYDAYTFKPTDRHEQQHIELQHRRGDVDSQMAPLILSMWKLNFETTGSCQEMDNGKAYVSLPVVSQGRAVARRLIDMNIPFQIDFKTDKYRELDSEVLIEVETCRIRFKPELIELITNIFEQWSSPTHAQ